MKTIVIKGDKPTKKLIEKAVDILKNGGLIVYPTETCYGIGCDALNENAVEKVYRVKKREKKKPLSIIVSSLEMMRKYGKITKEVEYLVKKFMPGPLTIVVEKKRTIPDILNPKEIAFRISSHPIAQQLVKELDKPITATSANISGSKPIYSSEEIVKIFNGKVDMIIDSGNLPLIQPSTIIRVKKSKIELIREGAIPFDIVLREFKKIIE